MYELQSVGILPACRHSAHEVEACKAAVTGDRDNLGRLRVPSFVRLLREHLRHVSRYDPAEFKRYVEEQGLLCPADWDAEVNGYAKWKHRVDRAAQKVFTNV